MEHTGGFPVEAFNQIPDEKGFPVQSFRGGGQAGGMVCALFRGLAQPTMGTEAGSVHNQEAAKGPGTQTGEQRRVSETKGS